ncbi:MAG: hypothetical protein ACR2PL_02685 [Dehalococcoidia bacterium]
MTEGNDTRATEALVQRAAGAFRYPPTPALAEDVRAALDAPEQQPAAGTLFTAPLRPVGSGSNGRPVRRLLLLALSILLVAIVAVVLVLGRRITGLHLPTLWYEFKVQSCGGSR